MPVPPLTRRSTIETLFHPCKIGIKGAKKMQPIISKTKSDKFLYQDEAQEAIKQIPYQGLRITDSKWELVESQNRVTMTLRNDRDDEIEIRFLPVGSPKATTENIKRQLANHTLITC
jgi:hypothetical protein